MYYLEYVPCVQIPDRQLWLYIFSIKQADIRSPAYYFLKHWRLLLMSDINLDNKLSTTDISDGR